MNWIARIFFGVILFFFAGAAFLGLLISGIIPLHWLPIRSGPLKGSEPYTYVFVANTRHFVFAYDLKRGGGTTAFVAYDVETKKLTSYGASSGFVASPSASSLENALYINYAKKWPTPNEFRAGTPVENILYKCDLIDVRCRDIFQYDGSIGNIVEFPDGDMLFASAKPEMSGIGMIVSKEMVRYRNFDFYLRHQTGQIERLTDWDAGQLGSVSLGGERLVFQVFLRQISNRPKSEIYSALLTPERRITGLIPPASKPFVEHGSQIDTQPSISPDGKKTAFKSVTKDRTDRSGWRYDIVIFDNEAQKPLHTIVPEPGIDLSPPKFVDANTVRFMSSDGRNFRFRQLDLLTGQETVLGEVTAKEIESAPFLDVGKTALRAALD